MGKEKLVQFIRSTLPMPLDKANQLVKSFKERQVLKNDFILKQGNVCNETCFIENGFMRVYILDKEENEITTGFYSKGMFAIDHASFFRRIPTTENMHALTACRTWYISYDDLQASYHTFPEFREVGRLLLVNNNVALKQALFSVLHDTAEQRYANLINKNPEIFQHTSLKNIASYLGITDTSLSRIRKEFIKR